MGVLDSRVVNKYPGDSRGLQERNDYIDNYVLTAPAAKSTQQVGIKCPGPAASHPFCKNQEYLASHERGRSCPRTPYYALEFAAQSISLSEASRMFLRCASSNPWVSFQHLQLGQPPRTGTPWTSVTMTRPTATVAQVMTSSSQVQSPPSSHPRALSVCVLVLCVCVLVSHGWHQGTGRPLENRPLPPHAWLRFLVPRTSTKRSQ